MGRSVTRMGATGLSEEKWPMRHALFCEPFKSDIGIYSTLLPQTVNPEIITVCSQRLNAPNRHSTGPTIIGWFVCDYLDSPTIGSVQQLVQTIRWSTWIKSLDDGKFVFFFDEFIEHTFLIWYTEWFQHILALLNGLTNVPSQRAECLVAVWLHVHSLIKGNTANMDKLLQHIVKMTLESMLMVRIDECSIQRKVTYWLAHLSVDFHS